LQPSWKGTAYITSAGGGNILLTDYKEAEEGERHPPFWGNFHHFTKLSVHKDGEIDVRVHVVSKDKDKCGRDREFDYQIVPGVKATGKN
jgi:hypothetical protein